MNSSSAVTNSAAERTLISPFPAAWAPALIAARIAALLMPPRADMTTIRSSDPCISRRTSWKNDILGCGPLASRKGNPPPNEREEWPLRPQQRSIALRAIPFVAACRRRQYQHEQHHHGGDDK